MVVCSSCGVDMTAEMDEDRDEAYCTNCGFCLGAANAGLDDSHKLDPKLAVHLHNLKHAVGSDGDSISATNRGYQMLKRAGWTEGEAIGAKGAEGGGIVEPIAVHMNSNRCGLGLEEEWAAQNTMRAVVREKEGRVGSCPPPMDDVRVSILKAQLREQVVVPRCHECRPSTGDPACGQCLPWRGDPACVVCRPSTGRAGDSQGGPAWGRGGGGLPPGSPEGPGTALPSGKDRAAAADVVRPCSSRKSRFTPNFAKSRTRPNT